MRTLLPPFCLAVFGLALLVGLDLPIPIVRTVAAASLILALVATWQRAESVGWVSPLLLLGGASMVFYSFLPAIAQTWAHPPWIIGVTAERLSQYVGSAAESRILGFSICTLGWQVLFSTKTQACRLGNAPISDKDRLASLVFSLAAVTVAGIFYAIHWEILVPLAVTCMAIAVILALYTANWQVQTIALVSALSTIILLLAAHQGKVPVLVGLSLILAQLTRVRSAAKIFITAIAMAALVTIALNVMLKIRYPHVESYTHSSILLFQLNNKAVIRQSDTGYCLLNTINEHDENNMSFNLLKHTISIFVPRLLWSDKPNYSLGSYYMKKYCGVPENEVGSGSASITLIGQPLILGGRIGAVLATLTIVAFCSGLVHIAKRLGLAGLAALAALTPWVADFDQDFALYLGNACKNMLLISPIVLGLWLYRNQTTRLCT